MRKIEIVTIGILFGAVPIIICFLAGWWISLPFFNEMTIVILALAGILVGVFIDFLFLKRWIQSAYSMKPVVWMMIYLFYSIGMFGFFMGVPVFNVLLAFPAGFFIGGWLVNISADSNQMKKAARYSALFTTGVLTFNCTVSAIIALLNSSTASDLQGMLGIQITHLTIIEIILGGGIFILILQWWLTFWSVKLSYKYFCTRFGLSA